MNRKYTLALILSIQTAFALGAAAPAFAAGNHAHNDSGEAIKSYRPLTDTEQTIQAVLDAYATAMEQRSINAMTKAVLEGDFSTIESGYANWTWEDFRDNHLAVEMENFSDVDYRIDLVVGETQGSLGFAVFKFTASGQMNGQTSSISGLGTAVIENTTDGWRIHHLHTSAPRTQLDQAQSP